MNLNNMRGYAVVGDITCYKDKERTKVVAKFKSISDTRKFLGVKAVGNSLERASETGNASRGYYWKLENMKYVTIDEFNRKYKNL